MKLQNMPGQGHLSVCMALGSPCQESEATAEVTFWCPSRRSLLGNRLSVMLERDDD